MEESTLSKDQRYRRKLAERQTAEQRAQDRKRANERVQRWRAANPDRVKAINAASYAANRERIAESRKERPEVRRAADANRRARKAQSQGAHTSADRSKLLRLQNGRCAACGDKFGSNGQCDHIVPLALGGSNDRSNLQWLCRRCNLTKAARDPLEFANSLGRLL